MYTSFLSVGKKAQLIMVVVAFAFGLTMTSIVTTGCGGGETSFAQPADATKILAQASDEIRSCPVYLNEITGEYHDMNNDTVITQEQAITALRGTVFSEPSELSSATRAQYWYAKVWFPVYNWKHRWHWLYLAYDSGHPMYDCPAINNRPHLNIDKYQTLDQLTADNTQKTSRRAFYLGHFSIYRSGGSGWCAVYFVSYGKGDGGPEGYIYDNCITLQTARSTAWATSLVVGAIGLGQWLSGYVEPLVQQLQYSAGAL